MQELTPQIIAILQKYMGNPAARVGSSTTLDELAIDRLDLPMIFLDVEGVFDVQIEYHDDIENLATIGCLVTCVASSLETKALQADARKSAPRKRSTWVSTRAASR
jgi:acyl carrier protein